MDQVRSFPGRETGGILMGYTVDEDTVVTEVVGPGPRSSSGRRHFKPDANWQAAEVARIYADSGRTMTYLGDWHSHPNSLPFPSMLDLWTARQIASSPDARNPNPLILIVGGGIHSRWLGKCYRYDEGELKECELIQPGE